MTGLEIKGRLDRIGKTPLEHFQDIKELEVADGPEITVEDLLPYKCEQVEKSLKALEIIKEKVGFKFFDRTKEVKIYLVDGDGCVYLRNETGDTLLPEEEFNLLKEVLE